MRTIPALTPAQQSAADAVAAWLAASNRGPVVLIGPRRCGKTFLAEYLAREHRGVFIGEAESSPVPLPDRLAFIVGDPPRSARGAWLVRLVESVDAGKANGLVVRMEAPSVPVRRDLLRAIDPGVMP